MTTWSCKAPAAILALGLLAGCEDGAGASFLDNFGALTNLGPDIALSQASMAFGAIDVVAPRGFCIDKRTLKEQFALMARCDTLGAPSAAAGAPLGVITVSVAPAPADATIPSAAQTSAAFNLEQLGDAIESDTSVIFRAAGGSPLADTSPVHWRGTARIGDQFIAVALYGPEEGRAISNEGREVLSALIARSGTAQ